MIVPSRWTRNEWKFISLASCAACRIPRRVARLRLTRLSRFSEAGGLANVGLLDILLQKVFEIVRDFITITVMHVRVDASCCASLSSYVLCIAKNHCCSDVSMPGINYLGSAAEMTWRAGRAGVNER